MGQSKSAIAPYSEDGEVELNLTHFKLLRVVGKGSYGKVCPLPFKEEIKQP
jgi:hypothetical protein